MADNDNDAPEIPVQTTVEQALKVPAAIIAPTLGVIVEILEKIAGDLTPEE